MDVDVDIDMKFDHMVLISSPLLIHFYFQIQHNLLLPPLPLFFFLLKFPSFSREHDTGSLVGLCPARCPYTFSDVIHLMVIPYYQVRGLDAFFSSLAMCALQT